MKRIRLALTFFSVFLLLAINMQAQICTGSLGDPVVNVTFGAGGTIGNPLSRNITTYNFFAADCPDDGNYTITSSTNACFGGSWHSLQDHTPGDANGYMMLVNASFNPGDFYVDTARGLCANTTYEFSAWVVNVLLTNSCSGMGIDPNLVFNIETTSGQVLGTYSTGDIPESSSPQWKQYGLFFTTPANTSSVVIRLTNNAPGGCGNDVALDDITFRPCGPQVDASINLNATNLDACATGSAVTATLSATVGAGYAAPRIQWQESVNNGETWVDIPGAVNTTYLFSKSVPGSYLYRLSAAEGSNILISNCRVASNVLTITIHSPVVVFNTNSPVCENGLLTIEATGAATYNWTGPAGFTSRASSLSFNNVQLTQAGLYNVRATDAFGCVSTSTFNAQVFITPVAVVSNSQGICEGDSIRLVASGGDSYTWSPSTGLSTVTGNTTFAKPASAMLYTVSVTNGTACTDTASVNITVWQRPTAGAGPDKVVLENVPVVLEGTATGSAISYYWLPADFLSNASSIQPLSNADKDTTYTLYVVSNVGCGIATDRVFVRVFAQFYVPNAFSPDGNGYNDTWRIEALQAFPNAVLSVYNRLGQKIFESTGGNSFWDGTYKGQPQDPGTYVYLIDFRNGRPVKKGWVILIR